MKKGIVVLLTVLVLFSAIAVPSDAWRARWMASWRLLLGRLVVAGSLRCGLASAPLSDYPYPYTSMRRHRSSISSHRLRAAGACACVSVPPAPPFSVRWSSNGVRALRKTG